jgi:ATP-dependent DNA helicase RecG
MKGAKEYIEIIVPQSPAPISYKGIFHFRSGSTKQELKGAALQNWLLQKAGKHWENMPVLGKSIEDIDVDSLKLFTEKAIQKDRIPVEALYYKPFEVLESLNLIVV